MFLGIASFLFFLLLHILWWRTRLSSQYRLIAFLFLGGIGLAVNTPSFWTSAPVFAFFWILYLFCYYALVRSVSVRILGELVQSDGTLTRRLLEKRYDPRTMVRSRLDHLCKNGWLLQKGETFILTPKGRLLSTVFATLKHISLAEASG